MDQRGLINKFTVTRNDASPQHKDCQYFVLDLTHDPFAIPAIKAYAKACRDTHPGLARDLQIIVGLPDFDLKDRRL
jgi:hypothetical protein